MDDESAHAADDRTGEYSPGLALKETCQTQRGESQQIVQDHRLPAPGISAVKDQLQQTEDEACRQSPSQTPAQGIDDDGEHHQRYRAALRHVPNFNVAENFRNGHEECALHESTKCVVRF